MPGGGVEEGGSNLSAGIGWDRDLFSISQRQLQICLVLGEEKRWQKSTFEIQLGDKL